MAILPCAWTAPSEFAVPTAAVVLTPIIFVVLIPALLELQVPPAATLILTSTVFVPELYAKVLPRPIKLI